uniref:RegA n=2 Tax=Volvox obversus TaxID=47289 RepID=A0A346RPC7_9CHLO|nr:RegA [Volvox obversus]
MEADSNEEANDNPPVAEARPPQPVQDQQQQEQPKMPPQPQLQQPQPQPAQQQQQQQHQQLQPTQHRPQPLERLGAEQGPLPAGPNTVNGDPGSGYSTPRPLSSIRMLSPSRGSTPLALRPIVYSSAARNPDGTPQTPRQAKLTTPWSGSSSHAPTGGTLLYNESMEPSSTSVPTYPRAVHVASPGGSAGGAAGGVGMPSGTRSEQGLHRTSMRSLEDHTEDSPATATATTTATTSAGDSLGTDPPSENGVVQQQEQQQPRTTRPRNVSTPAAAAGREEAPLQSGSLPQGSARQQPSPSAAAAAAATPVPQLQQPQNPQYHEHQEQPPPPQQHEPAGTLTGASAGSPGSAADAPVQSAENHGHGAGDSSAGDGAGGGGAAAARGPPQQELGQNLEELVAALPPGPIHVTVAVRVGAGGRRPRGGNARVTEEEARSGYMRGHACGVFDVPRYLAGRDCIHNGSKWMSRSQFEKLGGSKMAKWYRSIRVLPDLEPLGEWLERHGMPVTKGPARRSRKRPAESGDEQMGQGTEQETAVASPEATLGPGAVHALDGPATMPTGVIPAPPLVGVPASVAGLPTPASLLPLTQLAGRQHSGPLQNMVQLPSQAAAAAPGSAAVQGVGSLNTDRGPSPKPRAEQRVDISLEALADRFLKQPRSGRGMDRRFLQVLLNTLPLQDLLVSHGAAEAAATATAATSKDENDHDAYSAYGGYVDYGAFGSVRTHESVRGAAAVSPTARSARAPGTGDAQGMSATQAEAFVAAAAAAAAAARYHRISDVTPPGPHTADAPRLRWRSHQRAGVLERSQSSSDPLTSPVTAAPPSMLHLDLHDPQISRDLLADSMAAGADGCGRSGGRPLLPFRPEQIQLLRSFIAQHQLMDVEDCYYGNEAELEEEEGGVSRRGAGAGGVDLTRPRVEPPPPSLLRRALSGVMMPHGTRVRRFEGSEVGTGAASGLDPPSAGFGNLGHSGNLATRSGVAAAAASALPRQERRLPPPPSLPPASSLAPEEAAALARGLAALQGLDVAAGGPAQGRDAALHPYPARPFTGTRRYRQIPEADHASASAEQGFCPPDMYQAELSPRGLYLAAGEGIRGAAASAAGAGALRPYNRRRRPRRWLDDEDAEEDEEDVWRQREVGVDAPQAAQTRFYSRLPAELQSHLLQQQRPWQQHGHGQEEVQQPLRQLSGHDTMEVQHYTVRQHMARLHEPVLKRQPRGRAGFSAEEVDEEEEPEEEEEEEEGGEMAEYWEEDNRRHRAGHSVGDFQNEHPQPLSMPQLPPQPQPRRPTYYAQQWPLMPNNREAAGPWRPPRTSMLQGEPQGRRMDWPQQPTRSEDESPSD